MEFSYDKKLFLIESLRRCDMTGVDIHNILSKSWPEEAGTVRQIQKIMQGFSSNHRNSFERAKGQGRQMSETRKNNVATVREAVEIDNRLSERRLSRMLNIEKTMVHRILNEDLELIWMKTKWVPHKLNERNYQHRIECCENMLQAFKSRIVKRNLVIVDEKYFYSRYLLPRNDIGSWIGAHGDVERLQTPRRRSVEKKWLVFVAVTLNGVHYFEICEGNVNAEKYIQYLKNMGQYFATNAHIQMENMALVQDNARPHVAATTLEFIAEKNIRLVKQAPYSPDTNMCDRFVFPRLEALRGENPDFLEQEQLEQFLSNNLPTFTGEMMKTKFQELIKDMQGIIDADGHYL